MLFSSHRFGNLTRHADLLLYVSTVFLALSFSIDVRHQIHDRFKGYRVRYSRPTHKTWREVCPYLESSSSELPWMNIISMTFTIIHTYILEHWKALSIFSCFINALLARSLAWRSNPSLSLTYSQRGTYIEVLSRHSFPLSKLHF